MAGTLLAIEVDGKVQNRQKFTGVVGVEEIKQTNGRSFTENSTR